MIAAIGNFETVLPFKDYDMISRVYPWALQHVSIQAPRYDVRSLYHHQQSDAAAKFKPLVRFFLFLFSSLTDIAPSFSVGCLGGAVVGRRARDRKVAGSTPGRSTIKSTQPSIPPG